MERCRVHRDQNAITVTDERGTVHVPAAVIGALLLGPGTSISHQAMVLLADSRATTVVVGEEGVRYYAHGRPLAGTSRWLVAQARAVSNQSERLAVARRMYAMRFGDEDVSGLTMQQLRGREGARVRNGYRQAAKEAGIEWKGRDYSVDDFAAGDELNQALSAATACLYGVAHTATVSLGCSPGLGFIHTGNDRSFIYDIADLYKMEIAVPVAFHVAASGSDDIPADARRAMRDEIYERQLMKRCIRDIQEVLNEPGDSEEVTEWDVIRLWAGSDRTVAAGQNHAIEPPW